MQTSNKCNMVLLVTTSVMNQLVIKESNNKRCLKKTVITEKVTSGV